jgi:hypothetical protein
MRTEWDLKGKIIRSTQAEIFSVLTTMKSAYSVDGFTATMLDNNGNPTTFYLDNNLAVGGVRVSKPISHGEISGAHGTTYLKYEFGLMADYLSNPGGDLTFQESVSFNDIDGGPIQVERIPAQGSPILQNVSERSWYYATQQGQLTQQGPGLAPMQPLFPGLLRRTPGSRVITYLPVKTIKGVPIEYGISWKYEFISTDPMTGRPNVKG